MTATTVPTTTGSSTRTTTSGRYVRAGLLSGLIASALVVVLAVAADVAGVSFEVEGEAIPLLGFAQITFLSALLGVGLAAAYSRWASRPRRTFLVTTVVLTAVSCVPPVAFPFATSGKVALEVLHLAAAAIIIPAIANRLAD